MQVSDPGDREATDRTSVGRSPVEGKAPTHALRKRNSNPEGCAMKLNSAQIEKTLRRLNAAELNAEAIPAEHPAMSRLEQLFGDHTYFLDSNGLNIVEPVGTEESDGQLGVVVNLADWTDAHGSSLQPHEPEPTELVVDLATGSRH
jgi:hypothetical protein